MWHFISEQISECIQLDFICDDIREVKAGDSHKAYKISDGKQRFFVKTNEKIHLSNFEAGQNYQDVQDPAITVLFKWIVLECFI